MFGSLSTKIAHATPALGNQDLRLLQESINKEKEIVASTQRLSKDVGVAADALKQWGAAEGEDLADVTNVALSLLNHVGIATNTYADHELAIRAHLKDIRTKEEQLEELRRRKKAVASKLEAQERRLSKMGPENKSLSLATEQLTALQNELRQLDNSILVDMARLSDHKRRIVRSILVLKFGGLVELGEKLTIIGELGKLLAMEVPQDLTPPGQGRAAYMGRTTTQNLLTEAARCVAEVTFNPNADDQRSSRTPNTRNQALSGIEPTPAVGRMPNLPAGMEAEQDSLRFRENSRSMLGQSTQHRGQSSVSSMGGTMPPMRDQAPLRGPVVDEFGRPIDGLPIQANTMPALGGGAPIQQAPLSEIQQSMRSPDSAFGSGMPATLGSSGPPRPPLNQQQQQQPSQFNPPVASQYNPTQQRPLPAPQQPPVQRKPVPGVERGLTLSLPIRSPAPKEAPRQEEKELNLPIVAPAPNPPSAFKKPQPTPARQTTTDSDIVLAEGETDLQRTTTLPPKLGIDEFPAWSLGLGDIGLGGDSPVKEAQEEPTPESQQEKSGTPDIPPKETVTSTSASSGDTQLVSESTTQTPTAYTDTPITYAPTILHDHVVDNPQTRSSSNSGRFAMFPDKRQPTGATANDDSGLLPPQAKFASRPGLNRTPSPYPMADDASPIPTPSQTPREEIIPVNSGITIPPDASDVSTSPPKSILLDASHSRSGSRALPFTSQSLRGTPSESISEPPRLRFAPRPPSPVTPSPVTATNGAWASKESFETGSSYTGIDLSGGDVPENLSGNSNKYDDGQKPAGRLGGNRLSVITPLGIQKNKDGGSQPTTPRKEYFETEDEVSEEQFKAMIDSFAAQVGSPNNSTDPSSGMDSLRNLTLDSAPNTSIDNTNAYGLTGANRRYLSTTDTSIDINDSESAGYNASYRPDFRSPQDSSLDTTAAVAGSPFPSPNPPAFGPAQSRLRDGVLRSSAPMADGNINMAGVGSGHRRGGSAGSGGSGDSHDRSTITAGAFRRGKEGGSVERNPGLPATPAAGRMGRIVDGSAPGAPMSSAPQRRSYQMPNVFNRSGTPDSVRSDNRSENTSAYPTPQIVNDGRVGLPPGAAAPSRFGGADLNQANSDSRRMAGEASPNQEYGNRARSPIIPSSLIPGRPGSAAPLAPIGHVRPPASTPMNPSSGSYHTPSYPSPIQGNISAPWQSQRQPYQPQATGPVNPYAGQPNMPPPRDHSPITGDFDGSALLQDAYGGMDESPYAGARMSRPGGGYGGY